MNVQTLDVLIVGAGPVGLAAGIEAKRAGISYLILEAGTLCQSLVEYPAGMRFFSPADDLAIGSHPFPTPHDEKPTREIALNYYRKVATAERLNILTYQRVTAVEKSAHVFRVAARDSIGKNDETYWFAANVLFCSGVWGHPRHLEAPGAELPLVQTRLQDPLCYWQKRVLIVGSGNSAAEAAIRLSDAGAVVHLAIQPESLSLCRFRPFVLRELQMRVDEGKVTPWLKSRIIEIQSDRVNLSANSKDQWLDVDFVLTQLGMEADRTLLETLRVEFGVDGKPVHNLDTFETNARGVYVAGAISQEGFIFLGKEHVKKIIASILAGKHRASANHSGYQD